jgi:hypothetical protein
VSSRRSRSIWDRAARCGRVRPPDADAVQEVRVEIGPLGPPPQASLELEGANTESECSSNGPSSSWIDLVLGPPSAPARHPYFAWVA